jgi:hypothetical protein
MRLLVLILFVLPLLAQEEFSREKERVLGQSLANEYRKRTQPFRDPGVEAYVVRIGSELARGLVNPRFAPRFEIVSSEDAQIQGFPAGHIFVPIKALSSAASEEQFVEALAHAIAHSFELPSRERASIPLFFGHVSGPPAKSMRHESDAEQLGTQLQRNAVSSAEEFNSARETARRSLAKERRPPTLRRN